MINLVRQVTDLSGIIIVFCCLLMVCGVATSAEPRLLLVTGESVMGSNPSLPFLLEADVIRFDEQSDTVFANGNVQIAREGRVLTADEVQFRRRDKILAAKGSVVLAENSGEVLFADEVELTEDLDQGYAVAPQILLPDGSRLAARGAKRVSKDRFEIYRGVYSPCAIMTFCGVTAPMWQVRANVVTHSDARREIAFSDATLDVFGVPVAWLPYFTQPDPRVKRKTGFLAPTFGSDSDLGFLAQVPFFWNISENQDLTLTPIITSREYPVALLEYRHLFPWGKTAIETSFGMVERRENNDVIGTNPRGHIKWTGDANIDENWRAKAQLYRSSDDTYLRKFKIDSSSVLRSFATLEGFYANGYVNATTFSAQDQRIDFVRDDTPDALPYITAEYRMPLGATGLDLTANTGFRTLFRTDGADSQHLAGEIGLGREWLVDGHIFDAKVSIRGDLFAAQEIPGQANDPGYSGRALSRATLGWAYPVFRPIDEVNILTLTPRAMLTGTTGELNSGNLPNEDSQSVEFDSTALFRPALSAGWDRFDDGQRFDYGLEGKLDTPTGQFTGLVGQSYRIGSGRAFGSGTGLDRTVSDVVIGAGAHIDKWFDGAARMRWNAEDSSLSAAEARVRVGYAPIQLSVTHTLLDARTIDGNTLNGIHQMDGTIRAKLSDYWVGFVRHQRDLQADRPLRSQIGLSYADECLRFETVFTRESFQNPEVKDDNSIIFRIALRNFGLGANNHQGFFRE